ncbi:hypothetical protein BT69DRAFT_1347124 [Atractiella rhizophila]|nr:hypothetical protein BT69DRAFT_1347124 [Atractiella rhizophila]
MPLHRIYHTPGAFTDQDKKELADSITSIYARMMPAFFVVVLFLPVEANNFFIGGKSTNNFVRITVEHLHIHFQNKEQMYNFASHYETKIAPWIKAKGYDWEISISDTPREGWRENGINPPLPVGDAAEQEELKAWITANKPLPRREGFNPFSKL